MMQGQKNIKIIQVSFVFTLLLPLSASFHQCSTLIIILILFLSTAQMGEAWEPEKSDYLSEKRFLICFLRLIHYYLVPRTECAGRKDL